MAKFIHLSDELEVASSMHAILQAELKDGPAILTLQKIAYESEARLYNVSTGLI